MALTTHSDCSAQKPAKAGRKPAAKKSAKGLNKDTYTRWFREMYLMRKFEERCGQLYIQQKFGGSVTCTLDKKRFFLACARPSDPRTV